MKRKTSKYKSQTKFLNIFEFIRLINQIEYRFAGYIDSNGFESECWECKGNLSNEGYGRFIAARLQRNYLYAHRVSFSHFSGFDIYSDNLVLHKCDNTRCINPSHLFSGTHKDNSDDKCSKGRQGFGDRKGVKNGNSKLKTSTVDEILKLLPTLNNREISLALNGVVSHSMISNIRLGKSWSHYTNIEEGRVEKYSTLKQ